MSHLKRYSQKIDLLATQLEKLLKVINHSDPSAENVKHVLYDKYKLTLSDLAEEIKSNTTWSTFNLFLTDHLHSDLHIDGDAREIVSRKLIKDFENEFITRHELSEFAKPDPGKQVQRERIRQIRKQIRTNRKQQKKAYPGYDVTDMLKTKNQEKQGKSSLDKLVKIFSKIDPARFEN